MGFDGFLGLSAVPCNENNQKFQFWRSSYKLQTIGWNVYIKIQLTNFEKKMNLNNAKINAKS